MKLSYCFESNDRKCSLPDIITLGKWHYLPQILTNFFATILLSLSGDLFPWSSYDRRSEVSC